jgi:hypothetical protein
VSVLTEPERSGTVPGAATVVLRSWKAPIAIAAFTLIALALFVLGHREGTTRFQLSQGSDFIQLPVAELPTYGTGIVITVVLALMTAWAFYRVRK